MGNRLRRHKKQWRLLALVLALGGLVSVGMAPLAVGGALPQATLLIGGKAVAEGFQSGLQDGIQSGVQGSASRGYATGRQNGGQNGFSNGAPNRVSSGVSSGVSSVAPKQVQALLRGEFRVRLDGAELLPLEAGVSEAFVADPTIADVKSTGFSEGFKGFYIYGKKLGRTTLLYGGEGFSKTLDIEVVPDIGALKSAILSAIPDAKVEIAGTPLGLVLSGKIKDPSEAATVRHLASHYVSDQESIIDNMRMAASAQVNIKVHFAEVEKNYGDYLSGDFRVDRLGGTDNATVGGLYSPMTPFLNRSVIGRVVDEETGAVINPGTEVFNVNPVINSQGVALPGITGIFNEKNLANFVDGWGIYGMLSALEQAGKATILAEPNLTALSGQTAKFIAGGEFPIPVSSQNNQVTVSFKEYGIKLAFTPVVLSERLISLTVAAEVSELTDEGGVVLDQITVRGIKTRRAETSVELASGQSFSIAGLIRSTDVADERKVPILGDLPILGSLFRSESFRNNTSELVVVVTPYVVEPVDESLQMASPVQGVEFDNVFEKFWYGGYGGGQDVRSVSPQQLGSEVALSGSLAGQGVGQGAGQAGTGQGAGQAVTRQGIGQRIGQGAGQAGTGAGILKDTPVGGFMLLE